MTDITVTSNKVLYERLGEMRDEIADLAMQNVAKLTEVGGFTGPEALALGEFEKLKLLNDYDLLTIMLKGEVITLIEKRGYHNLLPQQYATAPEAIEIEGGLSRSEQSNIKDINNIIIPYATQLNVSIAEFWQTKKSKLREIIPYLKVMITGDPSALESVNDTVEDMVDDIRDIDPYLDDDEVVKQAVDNLVDAAQSETNKGLRELLRPNDIPPADAVIFMKNGTTIMVARLSGDQERRIRGSDYFDFRFIEIEDVKNTRPVKELTGKVYPTAEEILEKTNGRD